MPQVVIVMNDDVLGVTALNTGVGGRFHPLALSVVDGVNAVPGRRRQLGDHVVNLLRAAAVVDDYHAEPAEGLAENILKCPPEELWPVFGPDDNGYWQWILRWHNTPMVRSGSATTIYRSSRAAPSQKRNATYY